VIEVFFPFLATIDMLGSVVEVWIVRMPISIPSGGVNMQFDIPFVGLNVYLVFYVGEVGPLTRVSISGINNFQVLPFFKVFREGVQNIWSFQIQRMTFSRARMVWYFSRTSSRL
jgi:hypothetical protein